MITSSYPNTEIEISQLQLADIVETQVGMFNHAIVSNITETEVTFYRPYGHHADFSHTKGVICYIGVEEYSVPRKNNKYKVKLLRRTTLK